MDQNATVGMDEAPQDITAELGERGMNESFCARYGELRQLARARLRSNRRDTILDTTSLVHEFYIRMAEGGSVSSGEWAGFLQYAARVMRHIIIDGARRRNAARHGGSVQRVELGDEIHSPAIIRDEDALMVHEALEQLEAVDARLVRIVEMRYFCGMTEPEVAKALEVNERTVRREWQKARLLLAEAFG